LSPQENTYVTEGLSPKLGQTTELIEDIALNSLFLSLSHAHECMRTLTCAHAHTHTHIHTDGCHCHPTPSHFHLVPFHTL